jgi:hypothetical protein
MDQDLRAIPGSKLLGGLHFTTITVSVDSGKQRDPFIDCGDR